MLKRLLIADDHSVLLEGLARLLEKEYEIVGTASNGIELVVAAGRLRPDMIVLDVAMPGLNGIEAGRQILTLLPRTKLIFLTQQVDVDHLRAAFQAGASAYVAKQSASSELLTALSLVGRGGHYVTPLLGISDLLNLRDPGKNPVGFFGRELTTRQREVLRLIAEGKVMKEISATLKISVKTVEFHKSALMSVLGLRTTAELVRYALGQGIVS